MAREEIDCHGRAAVAIEPVSADSLRKTGIFADLAGDFRRFLLQLRPNWESGEDDARKAGFFRPILGCVRKPVRTLHCLAGAGGSEPPNSRIEMPYCFSTLVSRRPTASRQQRPVASRIITMSAFHSEAAIARQISHVRKVRRVQLVSATL